MLRNKIFVTSRPKGNTLQFVKDIFKVSNTEFDQTLVDARLKETDGDIAGVCIPYEMKTKYYTAKVDFWLDEIETTAVKETVAAYCKEETEISKVVDAFVFIFDKSKLDTFDTIKDWVPFLDQSCPNIKLCIGTRTKEPLTAEEDAEIGDWCLNNGIDYVDMDETTETPMDKVGMELALEILQTHFWDGMVKFNNGIARDEDLLREIQALELEKHKDILKLDGESDDDFDLPSAADVNKMRDELFGDIDIDGGLDKAFEAMKSMRDHGQNLSDEERRKMAAEVALSFAAQLGL
ncbi:hypothetical protein INT48_003121 [Thamnidium elegans]|uniref:Alpha-and gamma-adaptin-binding protein p34 n=1 Tax=Thamnidium elegans TaxID=101142 RepID=A0A8H7SWQ4_9FUNG|nr:hypothetical protein INT48_003121 [Thamnidium elegans]